VALASVSASVRIFFIRASGAKGLPLMMPMAASGPISSGSSAVAGSCCNGCSCAKRDWSIFQARPYAIARCMANTRPSHAAWNTGSFFSTSTLPKPSTPSMLCTLSIRKSYHMLIAL